MNPLRTSKKSIVTMLQIIITLSILSYLFRNTEKNKLVMTALSHAKLAWIAAAVGMFGFVEVIAIIRWQILLRIQGIRITWTRLASLFMIGTFFNPFMPGGTGGDVAKTYYLLKETPNKKSAAMLSIFMDRFMGFFGLLIIASIVVIIRHEWFKKNLITTSLLYILLTSLSAITIMIITSFIVARQEWVHKLPRRLPLRHHLISLSTAYGYYGRSWGTLLLGLLLCVPVHFGSFTLFYCVSRAFEESTHRATLFDFWGIMPIITMIISVPISIGGIGIREGLFINLLGDLCKIPEMTALTISMTGYAVLIFWGLIGGVIFLCYRPSKPYQVPDTSNKNGWRDLENISFAEESKDYSVRP